MGTQSGTVLTYRFLASSVTWCPWQLLGRALVFATAPIERREKYYMHSPKFRLQSAYANPGTRPAAKIAQEQAKVRYFHRGYDHPFTLNELKDFYFKLRENWLIQHYPGIQYPFVHRQMIPEQTEDPLKVPLYEPLGKALVPGVKGH